ncbi:MAG: NAD-dependent deacylase [Ignavibacteria bacterium]|nr:NAD-dependent deacylase [Ignavibacteria bacterium]MDP3831032.1 NAD-dependent deacylase [Ignavibacteriaceae bacterium]
MEINLPDEFITQLSLSKRIVFFTGAGISAESGIPTFRGEEGIWKKFRPEELANFNAFMRNPTLVWEWYQYRRKIVRETTPNPGHYAIVEFENYFDVTVVTQNVDNLHKRAGSKLVYELHGNIEKNYCIRCKKRYDFIEFPENQGAPICECGGNIRPDIVWFGEYLPNDQFSSSENAAEVSDIFFVVGTSSVVYPAASITNIARSAGSYVVEINITETEISDRVNLFLKGKSGEILPKIIELIKSEKAKT